MTYLKDRQVLITGGLGFIGSNLAHRCVAMGAKVTIYDCLDPRSGGNLYNLQSIRDQVNVAFHDIRTFDLISQHVINAEFIFNCAASTSHPLSMREPWLDNDVNSRAVINLLEAVRRFNRKAKLIHIGSTTQIGALRYQPADEDHPEFPNDIYSANKSAAEKYVMIYARSHQLNAVTVRLANVFGPRAAIHSPEFTFNNYFVGLALQNKDITVYGDGHQLRNILFVEDAVAALLAAAEADDIGGEMFLGVADQHVSIRDIALMTAECIGSGTVKFVDWPVGRKAIDVGDAVISNKKIKQHLGWAPQTTLRDGLLATKAFYQSCLTEYLR